MNPRTVLTLANGANIDLLNPQVSDFADLDWAAEHLAKENRFNGATPGVVYSVAQHQVECVDAAWMATQDPLLCAYLSLHDVHESLFKDDTTPKKRAFAALAEAKFGVLATEIMAVFDELTARTDAAVHAAAGLVWPPAPKMQAAIKRFDRILLVSEWRDLMGGYPLPDAESYADVERLHYAIKPVENWQTAALLLRRCWERVLPAFAGREEADG